ncbi:MAG: IS110 family transposase [Burkholderiaceae bacterium]|jgi:transposase|nr:IS110 family transposase [Burkholderiaceae bacterium]
MKEDTTNPSATIPAACTVIAVDLAKRVFQVAGEDALAQVIYETRIKSREAFKAFLSCLPAGISVLMETGPGAQAWARQLIEQGHQARILPAQRVEEHRSGAKNDRNDTYAILRAGRDSKILAVPIKSAQVLAMQALHRVRQGYIRRRTALANQMRGLLLEHGIALAQGDAAIKRGVPKVLDGASLPVPELLSELLAEMLAEWEHLGVRIQALAAKLQVSAGQDPKARQLMTVRGIGPTIATAMLAKQVEPERFKNARQFAAYFGIVPDQHSSGPKIRLGKMSKRGDGYIRGMMIEGAHAVLTRLSPDSSQPDDRRLLRWMQRHGRKGAAIRLANRNLRIVWVLLQNDRNYCRQPSRSAQLAQEIGMHD